MDEGGKDMSRRATAFLIWRAGEAVNWECTAQDIADEIGMDRSTVARLCKEKGWKIHHGDKGLSLTGRQSIDSIMKSPHMQAYGRN
jgi:Mn-dependent DtxR family transcriptional regulator